MRILRIATLCACALLLVADFSAAQQIIINGATTDMPVQMPGMGPRQPKTGTARLRGRVLSVENGGPVRRAQVRILSPDIGSKTAMTDAEGRYEFRELPAGRFNLSANKAGYVTVQYGQTRPFESGKPIDLGDGQILDKADISMPRGSAISGRLVDEFGDPVADAIVNAMRSVWSGGRRRLQPTGRTAMTNDLGQFRIYGLSPGDYYVNATFRGGEMMGMEIAMAAAMGAGGGAGGPVGSNPNSGYAPTYFPGTANGGEAQKITLAVGQEAQNTDFALLPVKLVRITGTVISSEGKPVEGSMINAFPRNGDAGGMMMMMGGNARSDKNGNFTMPNLAPGEYTLQTRSMQFMTSGSGDNMMFTARVGGDSGAEAETGSLPITVGGEDLSNVVIVTSKGATASGRLIFDDGSKPSSLTSIRVSASSLDAESVMLPMGGPGSVKADGTFELKSLSGARIIRAGNLPPGWMLKSVRVNGNDITDSGMDFKPGEAVNGIEVTLTAKLTEVNGTVKDGSQQVKDYTVVVFADEPQKWALPNSRYVTGSRPDQQGRFQIKNLPPGGYYAIAVDYLAQGEWGDPDVLERLKPRASTFSINEGETKTLNLTLR
jgi:protocatechuate 3,4-dioxygenase beta subunit